MAVPRGPRVGDAASLWNFTPSPGWSREEARVLKLLLMHHGVGRWVAIGESGLLPGKLIQQLNAQTQRLLGQQSLAAFTGLRVDVDRIRADNEARTDARRKAGLIINDGPNLTRESIRALQAESTERYGLSEQQLSATAGELERIRGERAELDGRAAAIFGTPLLTDDALPMARPELLALLSRLRAETARLLATARTLHRERAPARDKRGVAARSARPPAGRPRTKEAPKTRPRRPASSEDEGPSGSADEDWRPSARAARRPARARGHPETGRRRRRREDDELETALASLQAMGFSREACTDAMRENDDDVEAALDWLLVTSAAT